MASIGITLRRRANWMTRLDEVRQKGYVAAVRGRPESDNPYRQKTLRCAWRGGWQEGYRNALSCQLSVNTGLITPNIA